jgi:hypothetical protein
VIFLNNFGGELAASEFEKARRAQAPGQHKREWNRLRQNLLLMGLPFPMLLQSLLLYLYRILQQVVTVEWIFFLQQASFFRQMAQIVMAAVKTTRSSLPWMPPPSVPKKKTQNKFHLYQCVSLRILT